MKQSLIQRALAYALGPIVPRLGEQLLRNAVPWVTYNYQGAVLGGTAIGPTYSGHPFAVAEVKFDMAVVAAARVAAGQAAIAATDVLQAVGVRAGTWVPMVAIETTKVEGAVATADIGDGTSTAGYASGHNLNALGWSASLATVALSVATAGGKLYTVDDTIDVLINNNAVDVATFRLLVPMVDLRASR